MKNRLTTRQLCGNLPPSRSGGFLKHCLRFPGCLSLLLGLILGSGAAGGSASSVSPGSRFTLVLGGEAVRDAGTGLIWEQRPDYVHDVWSASIERCHMKTVGGMAGWRVPSVAELKSLLDLTQRDPALPKDHPFSNIKSAIYWTATPSPTDDIVAWQVSFFTGEAVTDQKSGTRRAWCVHDGDPTTK